MKPISQEEQKSTQSNCTNGQNMIADDTDPTKAHYKCVMCKIKIEDPSEIGAHLKKCRLVNGGLHMTENGPRRIGSQEQHAEALVNISFYLINYLNGVISNSCN